MTQPLYTETDNNDLNAHIDAALALEKNILGVDLSDAPQALIEEAAKQARGHNTVVSHLDELGYYSRSKATSFTEGGIEVIKKVTDVIDPSTGQPHAFTLSPEDIQRAQAQLQEGGAVVMGANGSTQMFNNIKDMFSNKGPATPKKFQHYFTAGKGQVAMSVDRSILEPNALVRLSSKSFEAKYLQQLEGYIYNAKDQLDPDKLYILIFLAGFIKEGKLPIKITSGKHRIQLPKIINTLNTYFNKNESVLFGIHTMFSGMTAPQPQAPEAKAE